MHTDARRGRASRLRRRLPRSPPPVGLEVHSGSAWAQPCRTRPEPSSPTGRAPRAGLLVARPRPGRRACCRAGLWEKSLPALDGCPHAPPVLTHSDPFLSRDGVESRKRRPMAASNDKPPLPGNEQETRPLLPQGPGSAEGLQARSPPPQVAEKPNLLLLNARPWLLDESLSASLRLPPRSLAGPAFPVASRHRLTEPSGSGRIAPTLTAL